MRIGSLFTGAGALDLAVEQVFGGITIWQCENDPAAVKVLDARFPHIPNLGDVTTIDWGTVPPVDVLCGGFPCTDVSSAGKRAGMHGTRSGLWVHMAEAIDQLRPRFVVVENVRGLLSAHAHRPMEPEESTLGNGDTQLVLRAIGAVLGDLADIGYDAQWVTVAASDVGACHRRERVFIVATSPDAGGGGFGGRPQCHLEPPTRIPTSSGDDVDGRAVADGGDDGRVELLPTPIAGDAKSVCNATATRHKIPPTGIHASTTLTDAIRSGDLLQTPAVADGDGSRKTRGANRSDELLLAGQAIEMTQQWGRYAAAVHRWERLTRPVPSPTEPNRAGKPRLNPAFSEWMMGWPQGWVTAVPKIGRNDQLRIIGNGCCPQQVVAALAHLLQYVEVPA